MANQSSQLSSDCAYAIELYDLVPLHCLQWFYIITSVVSIVLVLYTAHRYLHRTIFENVTKELIVSLYVFIVIYSVCLILAQGSQLTYRYIARDKCDAQVPKAWCILRYIITVTACSFVIIHIGMTALHALSSFHFGSRTQKVTARVSILLAFVYPAIYGIMAYHKDSLEGRTAYCSGFTANSESVLMFNVYLVLVLDVLNALASFVLWKYNQHKLNTESVQQSFNLSITFNRRQNLEAMRQFLPVAALHAVVYVVFFLTVCFGQAIRSSMSPGWYLFTSAVANVIPHYCFLCPLIFLILIRKGKFDRKAEVNAKIKSEKENSNKMYFAALNEQWT